MELSYSVMNRNLLKYIRLEDIKDCFGQSIHCEYQPEIRKVTPSTSQYSHIDRLLAAWYVGNDDKVDAILGHYDSRPKAKWREQYRIKHLQGRIYCPATGRKPKDIPIIESTTPQECAETRLETKTLVTDFTRVGGGEGKSEEE